MMSLTWCCLMVTTLSWALSSGSIVVVPGDAVIAGLFSLTSSSEKGRCDTMNLDVYQHLEAVRWTITKLNAANFIPGVKIGLVVEDTFTDSNVAADATLQILSEFTNGTCPTGLSSPCTLLGFLGPDYSSLAQRVSSLLNTMSPSNQYVQISYSSTSDALSDSKKYPNFFRVVPADSTQTMAMNEMLTQLGWTYIAIIYENDSYGATASERLKKLAEERGYCIPLFVPIEPAAQNTRIDDVVYNFVKRPIRIDGVVFIGSGQMANTLIKYFSDKRNDNRTGNLNFILPDSIELNPTRLSSQPGNAPLKLALGAIVFSPPYRNISEFDSHWWNIFKNMSTLDQEIKANPWLADVYTNVKKCACNISNPCGAVSEDDFKSKFIQNTYIKYAIEGAFSMAYLIKSAYERVCTDQNGICHDLRVLPKPDFFPILKTTTIPLKELPLLDYAESDISISFDKNGDMTSSNTIVQYEAYNFRKCGAGGCFVKVAELRGSELRFETDEKIISYNSTNKDGPTEMDSYPPSHCPVGTICKSCLKDLASEYCYQDGDIIFAAVIPVYLSSSDQKGCGRMYAATGSQFVEYFLYTMQKLQSRSDMFPGKSIGYIIINSCNSVPIATERISMVLRGESPLGNIEHKIAGFIGGMGSVISLAMSRVLTDKNIVQIAYSSTATSLSDREEHPNFMRVCTPDNKQANAMIQILRELKIGYIQIVFQDEPYGKGGFEAILAAIQDADLDICIAQNISVSLNTNFREVLPKLRRFKQAKVVILFLRANTMTYALGEINAAMEPGEFMYVGSEGMGKRGYNIINRPKLLGSISIVLEIAYDSQFDTYLDSLRVNTSDVNPWRQTAAEINMNCYFPHSFNKTQGRPCSKDYSITSNSDYNQDTWAPFIGKALESLAFGVSEAINLLCPSGVFCPSLRDHPDKVISETKRKTFDLFARGEQNRMFDDNGDGNVRYTIYNVQRDPKGNMIFVNIGQSAASDSYFTFRSGLLVYPDGSNTFSSNCTDVGECEQCRSSDSVVDDCQNFRMATYVLTGILGVTIILIIGYFVGRHLLEKRRKAKESKTYITPIYDLTPADERRRETETTYAGIDNSSVPSGIHADDMT